MFVEIIKKIRHFFNEFLLGDLILWILNIFIYIKFECFNFNEKERIIIFGIKITLVMSLIFYYFLFRFSKKAAFQIKSFTNKWLILLKFFVIFLLFIFSLFALPFIQDDYCRFFLILINIFSLIFLYYFFSGREVINMIFYAIRKKSKFFWYVVFLCISLNVFISVFLSCFIGPLEINPQENKYMWWQFFLFSLINCLCSLLNENNMYMLIIITMMTIINSSLFFISALIFADSVKTVFKGERTIIFLPTVNLNIKKYSNIKINRSSLLNAHQFAKEFWDKFPDYKQQINERLIDGEYIFINSNEKMVDVLKNIRNKLGNKLYKQYIEKINENTIKLKNKELKFFAWIKKETKLMNFDFYYYFQPLYEIKIPNNKDIDEHIKNLAKKYFINFDLDKLLNSEKSSKNEKTFKFFSLKQHSSSISLLQDFDSTRLTRVYYVRFKVNCWQTFNWEYIKSELNSFFSEKLKLKLLDNFYYYKKCKKTLALKVYDEFCISDDKTEKILNLKNVWFQDWFRTDKIKCQTFLEYKIESQEEKEQTLIKAFESNYLFNKFYNSQWVNKLDKKQNKLDKKKEKNKKNNQQDTNNNLIMMNTSLHKVIVVTNNLDRLEQDFKEKIFNFIGFENILNFNEKIYLSKYSFRDYLKEKHSFQFIVRNNFLSDAENLKRFKDLLNEYQYSYDRYNFNFNDQKDNKLNYQIIPITPLEDWDRYNKVSNNCEEIKIKIPKKFLHTHCCSKCIRKMKNK